MKTLLTLMLIISSLTLASQEKQIKIGYLVVIEFNNETTIRKATSSESLEKIVKTYFPKSDIDIAEFMKGSVYFEIRNYNLRFYVETKKIVKGKFRKLSKKEIREIETELK